MASVRGEGWRGRDGAVAVIIPAHNAAGTIDAALASIAAQELPAAEVVVADDASDDGTADVAERWRSVLPLRVVRLPTNVGPARARHHAIEASSSPLVALLDSDDLMLPDHLASLLEVHRGVDTIATARLLRWLPGTGVEIDWRNESTPAAGQRPAIVEVNFVALASLFSRDLYDRAGGFRDGMTGAEDWDLWIRMVRLGATVVRTDHPTVLYRLSQGSLSADGRNLVSEMVVLERVREEATSPAERAGAARALRRLRAAHRLTAAYELARQERGWAARRAALRCVGGTGAVRLRAAAVTVAPARAVRLRDRRKWDVSRWLRA